MALCKCWMTCHHGYLGFTLLPIFKGDSVMRIVQIAEAYSTQWAAEWFDIFQNIQYHF